MMKWRERSRPTGEIGGGEGKGESFIYSSI